MTERGRVRDASLAAVERELADVSEDATLVGLVRTPSPDFRATVDENRPALAPPPTLREAFERRREDLRMRGLCAEGAHNAAWEEVGVDERYAARLDGPAADALADLADRLRDGEDLVLVCDATTGRRSHRTVVRERLSTDG
jgi:uncharacterized protein YeaO (DUF488 family)